MFLPEYETLSLTVSDHIASVSLNRPDKANSMIRAMWDELQHCFEWLDSEPDVRVVMLTGEGRHFCAGIDLSMLTGAIPDVDVDQSRKNEMLRTTIKRLQANLTAIEVCRKPVLAAIHGACVGGGIDMTTCCDMRYASSDAYFSIKEVDLALAADVGTLQRLPHIIGRGMANELALTGRKVLAAEALTIGLVNRVYEDKEALHDGVRDLAAQIASKSPLAVRGTKEMLLYSRDHSVADGLNYVATWNSAMLSAKDTEKAFMAGDSQPDFDA
ncbi:MAG: crotonase/enoyl-CoA hydratase family protein [Pseudomonadales bacterium]